ncbi:hypothetical protein BDV41DRAFT_425007 [Aspergillus transmontanensis]|uniref:Uncharacterized protein n=1 Tax=Aspergillus transmontanensis TaxID=1034304 RepID=A0A5N6VN87_9EURO|nr:hypothetical protein BDV41DRAFT_425007 [Aspergillus transmontanensis]
MEGSKNGSIWDNDVGCLHQAFVLCILKLKKRIVCGTNHVTSFKRDQISYRTSTSHDSPWPPQFLNPPPSCRVPPLPIARGNRPIKTMKWFSSPVTVY